MDVNEHERPSNIILRHKLNQRISTFKVDLYSGCDQQWNCCDGEVILLRNHCFFVALLLSFLVRVA